jgi:iron-sulfur cluster assembly protein
LTANELGIATVEQKLNGIILTDNAAQHVRTALAKRGKGLGLKLGVKKTGCSGWAYKIEYADELAQDDLRFESKGVTVFVDQKSLPFLSGTEVDYARQGLNQTFKFNNPNVKDECGCGESFSV